MYRHSLRSSSTIMKSEV